MMALRSIAAAPKITEGQRSSALPETILPLTSRTVCRNRKSMTRVANDFNRSRLLLWISGTRWLPVSIPLRLQTKLHLRRRS